MKQIEKEYVTWQYELEFIEKAGLGHSTSIIPAALDSILALCVSHLREARKLEACENVLWGGVLPDTLQQITFFEQEIEREIDAAVEVHRHQEEVKRIQRERNEAEEEKWRVELEKRDIEERTRSRNKALASAPEGAALKNQTQDWLDLFERLAQTDNNYG